MPKSAKKAKRSVTLLIDGDPIVYGCAFAAQTVEYEAIYAPEDCPEDYQQHFFQSAAGRKAWEQAHPVMVLVDTEKHVTIHPASWAKQNLSTKLAFIQRECRQYISGPVDEVIVRLFLSSGESWRDRAATIAKYKGNRDKVDRPAHYEVLRGVLVNDYPFTNMVDGEADDVIHDEAAAMHQAGKEYIVCSIDKDLDQIPGVHYNYNKHVFYKIDSKEADIKFWEQTLAGDATDNIKGCPGIGVIKAKYFVESMVEQLEPENWWEYIVSIYDLNAPAEGFTDMNGLRMHTEDYALENARLVKLGKGAEHWTPKSTLKNSA